MHFIVDKLNRLTDKELKIELKNKDYLKPGELVIYAEKNKDPKIVKLLHIYNERTIAIILLDSVNGISQQTLASNLFPINYSNFKRFLTNSGNRFKNRPPEIHRIANFMEKILISHFGSENTEIKVSASIIRATIYIPEIKITNSLGIRHILRGVYITFKFRRQFNVFHLDDILFYRDTYTLSEWARRYVHSHINKNPPNPAYLSDFCFGLTSFDDIINKYKLSFPLEKFSTFIYRFISYLQWESIEGTPYKYLTSIKKFQVRSLEENLTVIQELQEDCYEYVINTIENFKYSLSYSTSTLNYPKITINTDSKKNIAGAVVGFLQENGLNEMLGYSIGDDFGVISPLEMPNKEHLSAILPSFTFKEKDLNLKVIDDSSTQFEELKRGIVPEPSPFLTNRIIEKLEKNYTNFLIKKNNNE